MSLDAIICREPPGGDAGNETADYLWPPILKLFSVAMRGQKQRHSEIMLSIRKRATIIIAAFLGSRRGVEN